MDIHRIDIHPSNYGGVNRGRRYIIMHGNGGTAQSTTNWFKNPDANVSYHYLVSQSGAIFQFCDEGKRAWHAGVSAWGKDRNLNDLSIGVALETAEGTYNDLTELQLDAARKLVRDIMERHDIPATNVLSHREVAPNRKVDPRHLDMGLFRKSLSEVQTLEVDTLVLHNFHECIFEQNNNQMVIRGPMIYQARHNKLDVRLEAESSRDEWQSD